MSSTSTTESNSDHESRLQQRNRELSILNAIAEALNREVDLSQALHSVLALVAQLLGLQTGWIWLLREDESTLFYLAAAQNLPSALADYPARMEGSCYCLDSYQEGDMSGAANINVVTCSRLKWLDASAGTDGLRYHASIPLYAQGKELGVLNVASQDWRQLAPSSLKLLHTIGDLLSIAIERARLFARSTLLGALEERNRLAREIHDTLAQGLAATALQLETADALLEVGVAPERVRQVVLRALELTRHNLEEARRSVMDLRAAPLEGRTLAEALAELVEEQARKSYLYHARKVQHCFDLIGEDRPLPIRLEVGLYRIAQEALTNIIRHADARHISLELLLMPNAIELTIEDDGQGFEPATVSEGHYGLIGLNERAKLLGGQMKLSSTKGEGTSIYVSVPLTT